MVIEDLVTDQWNQLISNVLTFPSNYSSEKSLVFHFAWLLKNNIKDESIHFDFEKQLYHKFSDGTFLDLYFEYQNQRIGIEFKFPKRSKNGYSNSTQTRIKSINDIKRLSFLVDEGRIDLGIFLMAVNERAYVFSGRKRESAEFQTYNNVQYISGCTFPTHISKSKEPIINPVDICFIWNGINETHIIKHLAWINPIFIQKGNKLK